MITSLRKSSLLIIDDISQSLWLNLTSVKLSNKSIKINYLRIMLIVMK